jgi:hypothetical protein
MRYERVNAAKHFLPEQRWLFVLVFVIVISVPHIGHRERASIRGRLAATSVYIVIIVDGRSQSQARFRKSTIFAPMF